MKKVIEKVETLINNFNTNCPYRIAKSLGIEVVFENLGNTLGYYNRNFRIKVIHINENSSDGQKLYTCCHELGHAILHPDSNTPFLKKHTLFSTEKIEVEANSFAVRMLFAKGFFNDQLSLDEAVEEFGIPKSFILSHLTNKIF
jgi:Zn-dependent peptidase ImmA (M78 family)